MRWPRKHWTLVATADIRDETSVAVAKAYNAAPQRFWSRHSAERARYFYEHDLKMPVKLWVVDADHMMEQPSEDPT